MGKFSYETELETSSLSLPCKDSLRESVVSQLFFGIAKRNKAATIRGRYTPLW
jgi:hypothetical protein